MMIRFHTGQRVETVEFSTVQEAVESICQSDDADIFEFFAERLERPGCSTPDELDDPCGRCANCLEEAMPVFERLMLIKDNPECRARATIDMSKADTSRFKYDPNVVLIAFFRHCWNIARIVEIDLGDHATSSLDEE